MKKRCILLLILCCYMSAYAQEMLVFMTPIQSGKTEQLKSSFFLNSAEEKQFFEDLGLSKYLRWVQTIHSEYYLIHFLVSHHLKQSLKNMRTKVLQKDPAALQLHELYLDVLNWDLARDNFTPDPLALTDMFNLQIENENASWNKEYCFIYPILPAKKDKLFEMFQDKSEYFSQQIQDVYRYRGITRQQLWVQETSSGPFLVIYQEIVGPVTRAREKYLHSKTEEISLSWANEFSDVTGLSYEELLPALESLFDGEILQ